jgi:hypothetical protein
VPTISTFFGIVIRMYYHDHGPPHFHAYYGEDMALIAVETLEVLQGRLPRRQFRWYWNWRNSIEANCETTGAWQKRTSR